MPPRTASTSRAKHKNTLKFESPPPKKFKAAKDVTILSVRGYTFKVFPLTQYIPKLSQRPVLKPGNKPPSSAPLLSNVVELDSATVKDAKGKGKAKSTVHEGPGTLQLVTRLLKADSLLQDDRLWADKYEPQSPGDLAVHKRKVDDVRRWLVEAFNEQDRSERSVCSLSIRLTTRWLENFQRLLILTGPAGSGKTTTLRMLAKEMNFEIIEHKTHVNTVQVSAFTSETSTCRCFGSVIYGF